MSFLQDRVAIQSIIINSDEMWAIEPVWWVLLFLGCYLAHITPADEDVLGECKCYNAIIGGNKSKHFQLSLILSQWLDGCGVECLWQLRLVWLCEWHWHCSTEAEHDLLRKWYTVDWINSMSISSELCQPAVRVCLKNWLFLDEMCAPRESPHIGMVFWCEVFSPSTRAQQKTRTETALTWMDGWRPSHSCASACSF